MIVNKILRAVINLILIFTATLEIDGRERIPRQGPYILVINHMSKADPPLILITMPGNVRLKYFAAEKWERHLIFGPLLRWGGAIFVNRGEVDRRALRAAGKALKEGSIFALAPEGTRSRVGALIQARDGAAYLATRARVPILPVGIENTDIVGHNMAHFKRTHIRIKIGELIELPEIDSRPKGAELSAYTHLIMIHIAALLPRRHWGFYTDSPAFAALLRGEDPWPYCLEIAGVTVNP